MTPDTGRKNASLSQVSQLVNYYVNVVIYSASDTCILCCWDGRYIGVLFQRSYWWTRLWLYVPSVVCSEVILSPRLSCVSCLRCFRSSLRKTSLSSLSSRMNLSMFTIISTHTLSLSLSLSHANNWDISFHVYILLFLYK